MKLCSWIILVLIWVTFMYCRHASQPAGVAITPQQVISLKIDSIKFMAAPGDLVTRLNDDMLSEMIKELADTDKSFSHSGIIFLQGNKKMVCHIYPARYPADTVVFEPLDSFINPEKNLSAGLFRYELEPQEKSNFLSRLQSYHDQEVHFDSKYDLQTDTALYCSEMIAKALAAATHNRIVCRTIQMPERLIPILMSYFKTYYFSYEHIKNTPFIPIESLYRTQGCKELLRTRLKYIP